MRMILFIFLISIAILSSAEGSKEVSCTLYNSEWFYFGRRFRTCNIEHQAIDDDGFVISNSRDESVEGLSIRINKNIKSIPENIAEKFPKLIALQVWNCSVKSIERRNFKNLRELKALYMAYNGLENVDSEAFKDQEKLGMLNLGFNQIEYLNPKTFASLSNLNTLYLENNKIKFLSQKHLENLINVKNISLKNNQLESVDENLFSTCVKLEWVWLNENKIKFIKAETFNGLAKLNYVDIQANDCVNKFYYKASFEAMKSDLEKNCVMLEDKLKLLESKIYKTESKNFKTSQDLLLSEKNYQEEKLKNEKLAKYFEMTVSNLKTEFQGCQSISYSKDLKINDLELRVKKCRETFLNE